MSREFSEEHLIERATEDVLQQIGWTTCTAWQRETLGPDGLLGRETKSEVVLRRSLRAALVRLNPGLLDAAYRQAIEIIEQKDSSKDLVRLNREKYRLMREGVRVQFVDEKGERKEPLLRVFDFETWQNNEFLAVRQFEVVGELYNRRPDVVGFVNGLPLVFFELKAHHTELRHAYEKNLKDYKDTIPALFHHNAFLVLSNGTDAKVGTVTSPYKFFLDWKRITEDDAGIVELDTLLRGVCEPSRLMDIFENFLLFDESGGDVVKIMAKNHQFIGVNKAIEQARNIEDLQGKLGVFWHTQGSGKSYSIVFICQKIHRKFGGSYTFLIVADRTELERQLYDTFTGAGAVTDKNVKARSRDHLRDLLKDNHRYIFSLIHKFSVDLKKESEYPLLTERKNIIVISDEAHRTQAGTFAQNMRFRGLPNASFLGFTGTPIIKDEEELTRNIFGEYVSVYDFKKAIDDEATLPLKYLNRGEKLGIENPRLDAQMAEVFQTEDLDDDQKHKLAYLFKKEYAILTAKPRLEAIARDLVWHFNDRGYQGKAMFVALDKPTAVQMFEFVMKFWPEYVAELKQKIARAADEQEAQKLKQQLVLAEKTEVCVVVSSEQGEVEKFQKLGLDIEPHRRKMADPSRDLEKEFKNEEHPFRLAIVCAMWITGFDAPCVSTVYLDKPIKGHTLMQTIARANRVFDDEKENGLIVDYGNVYQNLREAYSIYGEGGRGQQPGGATDEGERRPVELLESMVGELKAAIEGTEKQLAELGFELQELLDAQLMQKIAAVKKAVNCVCLNEKTRTEFETRARLVFRKFQSLYPEKIIEPFIRPFNSIEAIYNALHQKTVEADVSGIMLRLQKLVNESVFIDPKKAGTEDVVVDLSHLDFDALRRAFAKTENKNETVYDLQKAIDQKLQKMLDENPLRLEFYERYREVIEKYNDGKNAADVAKTFEELVEFIEKLSEEDGRAFREGLDEETLAIYDLLRENKDLSKKEEAAVKKVAKEMLEKLKSEKLRIERWRESREVTAAVKTLIFEKLQWLPPEIFTDEDVHLKTKNVYQHVYQTYPSGALAMRA